MSERVFISYSIEDLYLADLIRGNLEANGVTCWMKKRKSAEPDGNYEKEMEEAIENCQIFLPVLSKKAQSSALVSKEWGKAIEKNKQIIPVQIQYFKPNEELMSKLEDLDIYALWDVTDLQSRIGLVNTIKKALRLKLVNVGTYVGYETQEKPPRGANKFSARKAVTVAAVIIGLMGAISFVIPIILRIKNEMDMIQSMETSTEASEQEQEEVPEAPEQEEPQETAPTQTEPQETAPTQAESQETTSDEAEPEEMEPEEITPEETEAEEAEPEEAEPEETEPEETEQEEAEPEETESDKTKPENGTNNNISDDDIIIIE